MEEICIICYENLNKENIIKLNCTHKYHYKCFEKLMFINDKKNKNVINCPCCRKEYNLGKIPIPDFFNIENFYDLIIGNRNKCNCFDCYLLEFPLNNGFCKFHSQNELRIDELYYILRFIYIIAKDYEQKYKINLFNILNILLLKKIINKKEESIKKFIQRIKNTKNILRKKIKNEPTIFDVYEYFIKI
jgi:hypothetical protein